MYAGISHELKLLCINFRNIDEEIRKPILNMTPKQETHFRICLLYIAQQPQRTSKCVCNFALVMTCEGYTLQTLVTLSRIFTS